jgi:cephalosporin hydroxylase
MYIRLVAPKVHYLFFRELIGKTNNVLSTSWLGHPTFQNILDLWTIQETIALDSTRNMSIGTLKEQ